MSGAGRREPIGGKPFKGGDLPAGRMGRPVTQLVVMNVRGKCLIVWLATAHAFAGLAQDSASEAGTETDLPPGLDALLETGRTLWEQYAPPELQENYVFPGPEEVRGFLEALAHDLRAGTFEQLAPYLEEAREALRLLRLTGTVEGEALADWLEPRLDYLATARELVSSAAEPGKPPRTRPMRPGETRPPAMPPRPSAPPQPNALAAWKTKIASRPAPDRAEHLVPRLKRVFREEGLPEPLVWMAEVESSMNPKARSPVGARGLFQFMPETARRFGLRTFLPDERTDPEKSARAAAAYLRVLYRQFGDWSLALAAYNAGEGRVGRAVRESGARAFDAIAPRLPAETRMYVPKVLATIEVREGIPAAALPAPRMAAASRSTRWTHRVASAQ